MPPCDRCRSARADRCRSDCVAGGGIVGLLGDMPVACGSTELLRRHGFAVPAIAAHLARDLGAEGAIVTAVGWRGRARGLLVLSDTLRADAAAAVARLRDRRLHLVVLSGDQNAAVRAVANRVGIREAVSQCSPEGKVAAIAALRVNHGPVAAVGGGLNDGPALAAADVGIAMGNATDLARESAGVVLPRDGLGRLPDLFALAAAGRRVVIGNLAWAFGYNAAALALAAAGLLQPVLAAALMAGSSLIVIVNSRRLQRWHLGAVADAPSEAPADNGLPASDTTAPNGAGTVEGTDDPRPSRFAPTVRPPASDG